MWVLCTSGDALPSGSGLRNLINNHFQQLILCEECFDHFAAHYVLLHTFHMVWISPVHMVWISPVHMVWISPVQMVWISPVQMVILLFKESILESCWIDCNTSNARTLRCRKEKEKVLICMATMRYLQIHTHKISALL